jgi:DNA transposition AAA+ family ATPase
MSHGRWSKIREDKYNGDVDGSIEELRTAITRMEVHLAKATSEKHIFSALGNYHVLPLFQAIEGALQEAMTERGQNRLVFCVLPTGGGKTATCGYLHAKYDAKVIHAAMPSYRRSSMPFLKDLIRALGHKAPHSKTAAEDDVLRLFTQSDNGVLCIDEGNNFGAEAIDTLKAILNRTKWAVVFFTTPEHFSNMFSWYWENSNQLLRRAVAVIETPPMTASDVRPFIEPLGFHGGDLRQACELIADAANQFGHFDLIVRVAKRLARGNTEPSLLTAQKALTAERNRIRTDKLATGKTIHANKGRKAGRAA